MGRGLNFSVSCIICGVLFKVKKYRQFSAKYCSRKCCGYAKLNIPTWNKGKEHTAIKGDKNPNWIKDRTLIKRQPERNNPLYKLWRKEVLIRDGFKCVWCNATRVKFHVDHIKPYAQCIDSRYEISNGRVLCIPCHNIRHNRKTNKTLVGVS